uniref:Hypothetical chloroplast RF65 n=1 Tax=Campylaephora sungminbooi TaxID=1896769 RepID=A0A1B0RRG7_9FLOR|nr:hypothetical chloroplast RF65 [Campylaephora sungminbooi]AKU47366.1 hypothetical chloroplast RF65 [Campylaephora sungminbooi]
MHQFMHKINYLLISLEALNLDYLENYDLCYKEQIKKTRLNQYYINNQNLFKKNKIDYSYTCAIILINILYKVINKNKSSELVQLILKQDKLLNQYIKKFHHIYFNNQDYYTLYTKHEKPNIKQIAIINLYIIYIIIQSTNFLYLTYYLIT